MVETYTDRAKRVIAQAHQEAIQQGVTTVTPEHLLLSLLHEEPSLLSRLLAWRISPGSIRQQIEEYTDRPEAARSSPALTFSDESQQVLAYAGEEAARRMWPQVGPEHLVLGLLREERSVAAKVLYESGLRLTCVRDEVGYQE